MSAPHSGAPPPAVAGRIVAGNWFAIGLYAGRSPLELAPAKGVINPVLSYRDVTDAAAIFVADPFLLRRGGSWHMFFEVMNEHTYRGEIARAESRDGRRWHYRERVLVEPWSLSYPQVLAWRDQVYMLPDAFEVDRVVLYRADPFPTRWRPVATLVEGRLADATLLRHGGRWWLFACDPLTNDLLRLFLAERLLGPWREHPQSPIVRHDPRAARPAGPLIVIGRRLLRFAQVCAPRYGGGVRAFEVTQLSPTGYAERGIAQPPLAAPAAGAWNEAAMHHLCARRLPGGSWLAAIDGHDHPSYRA